MGAQFQMKQNLDWNDPFGEYSFNHRPSSLAYSESGETITIHSERKAFLFHTEKPELGWLSLDERGKETSIQAVVPNDSGSAWILYKPIPLGAQISSTLVKQYPDSASRKTTTIPCQPNQLWGNDNWLLSTEDDPSRTSSQSGKILNYYQEKGGQLWPEMTTRVIGNVLHAWRTDKNICFISYLVNEDKPDSYFLCEWKLSDNSVTTKNGGCHPFGYVSFTFSSSPSEIHGYWVTNNTYFINTCPFILRVHKSTSAESLPRFDTLNSKTDALIEENANELAAIGVIKSLEGKSLDQSKPFSDENPFLITSIIKDGRLHVVTTHYSAMLDLDDLKTTRSEDLESVEWNRDAVLLAIEHISLEKLPISCLYNLETIASERFSILGLEEDKKKLKVQIMNRFIAEFREKIESAYQKLFEMAIKKNSNEDMFSDNYENIDLGMINEIGEIIDNFPFLQEIGIHFLENLVRYFPEEKLDDANLLLEYSSLKLKDSYKSYFGHSLKKLQSRAKKRLGKEKNPALVAKVLEAPNDSLELSRYQLLRILKNNPGVNTLRKSVLEYLKYSQSFNSYSGPSNESCKVTQHISDVMFSDPDQETLYLCEFLNKSLLKLPENQPEVWIDRQSTSSMLWDSLKDAVFDSRENLVKLTSLTQIRASAVPLDCHLLLIPQILAVTNARDINKLHFDRSSIFQHLYIESDESKNFTPNDFFRIFWESSNSQSRLSHEKIIVAAVLIVASERIGLRQQASYNEFFPTSRDNQSIEAMLIQVNQEESTTWRSECLQTINNARLLPSTPSSMAEFAEKLYSRYKCAFS